MLLHRLRNRRRKRGDAPDYVLFLIEGNLPELAAPRTKWWQQLLPREGENLRDLARAFERISNDPRVSGVVLHLRPVTLPLSRLETLRDQLQRLRDSGKRVVIWSHGYDMATYYLASVADDILLQPGGMVAPVGLNHEMVFLKETLDEVGIEMDAVQISPYKSAPEIFTRMEPTEEARNMLTWLVEDAFESLVEGIARGRGWEQDRVRSLIDDALYTDLQAREADLVDGLLNEEELPGHLAVNGGAAKILPWSTAKKQLLARPPQRPTPYIALLRIEGIIVPGKSRRPPFQPPLPLPFVGDEQAGDLTVVQEARRVLEDDNVAAVVLFVDSQGGSSTASEAMASALAQVARKKPLVAVMGSVAASGGYYVATPAQWIIAQPGTLTGSIGVFTMKPVVAGLLDKLRVGRARISRGEHATLFDAERPFDEEERQKMWESINRIYDLFVERVAASRKMTRDEVEPIAGGRVWTGRQALERGLVDELGGLDRAFAKARNLAGLPDDAPVRGVIGSRELLPPKPLDASTWHSMSSAHGGALLICPVVWKKEL
jgi:protease-4